MEGKMDAVFVEREVLEDTADRWWIFLLTGIAWLVFALIVFQWDYVSVSAISYLFGIVAMIAGLFLLFKGIFDITVAFVTKGQFELWWLQLVVGLIEILLAFWVAGDFRQKAILLVVYVGIIALTRGISEIFVAFKLKGLRRRLAEV
jgi:uncharacterized membrane protein HdeD (DUF308 family)